MSVVLSNDRAFPTFKIMGDFKRAYLEFPITLPLGFIDHEEKTYTDLTDIFIDGPHICFKLTNVKRPDDKEFFNFTTGAGIIKIFHKEIIGQDFIDLKKLSFQFNPATVFNKSITHTIYEGFEISHNELILKFRKCYHFMSRWPKNTFNFTITNPYKQSLYLNSEIPFLEAGIQLSIYKHNTYPFVTIIRPTKKSDSVNNIFKVDNDGTTIRKYDKNFSLKNKLIDDNIRNFIGKKFQLIKLFCDSTILLLIENNGENRFYTSNIFKKKVLEIVNEER